MSQILSVNRPGVVVCDAGPAQVRNSGVIVAAVRVFNFRCLRTVEAPLGPTTVLIGENNVGKTSLLDALHAAIGTGLRHFTEEDVWLDTGEKHAPRGRSIIVDVLIRPVDEGNRVVDSFPTGSPWLELWGNGIVQDENDNDRDIAAIRARFSWSAAKGEYVTERRFLKEWVPSIDDAPDAPFVEKVPPVTVAQSEPISLFLLDAKRDGAEDIRSRSSIWHKLVSEPGLSPENIAAIEGHLNEINSLFVRESKVLVHVLGHLASVGDVVNCDRDAVSIDPVARRLRDLIKGMDVILCTAGASAFPLSRQGMGTRSLASVLVFRAYMSWQLKERKSQAIHPFLAIEEPETHLHPHAQRSLFGQLQQIPGQRIISTHSPYVCAQADIRTFLHFAKNGSETRIRRFDSSAEELTSEEMRKINREVMNTRGDLLFSRFIALFEGETEEQALPSFALMHWGCHPHEVGVSFVGVGGSGSYTPFLRLAVRFGIPWCIFSDGKTTDLGQVNKCLTRAGLAEHPGNPSVFVVPGGTDIEGHLARPEYLDVIRDMMADLAAEEQPTMNERGKAALRANLGGKTQADIADMLRTRKTAYSARIAAALGNHPDESLRVPELIKRLLDFIRPAAQATGTQAPGGSNGS